MAGCISEKRLTYYSRLLTSEGTLNILLVSTSQTYLEQLGNDLYVMREVQQEKRNYNLKVHTCKTIVDVLKYMPEDFYVDFIVFVLDAGIGNCLHEVESNLTWIDSTLPREKICLVNPESSYLKSMVSPLEIWEFAKSHQFNLINGQIKREKGLFHLSQRILNLAEACCGILNGIPMVNVV